MTMSDFHPHVKQLLDGELTLADLPPELRAEGEEALRLLAAVDREPVTFLRGRRGRPQILDGPQLPDQFFYRRDGHTAPSVSQIVFLAENKTTRQFLSSPEKAAWKKEIRAPRPGTGALCPG